MQALESLSDSQVRLSFFFYVIDSPSIWYTKNRYFDGSIASFVENIAVVIKGSFSKEKGFFVSM